jgi:DUF4097 and DUF4098 domain-containing protein YvlB
MKTNISFLLRTGIWVSLAITFHRANLHAAPTESNLKRSFAVNPGGNLIVDADVGSIDVATEDRKDISIEVKRSVTGVGNAKAQEIFAAHEVTFDQDGERVQVRAKFKEESGKWFRRGRVNYHLRYLIALPKRFNLDLHTAAGGITVADIEGTVKAKTSGGSLKFGAIKGSLEANTSAGSITMVSATGPVTVKTSGGNIQLGQLEADTTAQTSAGSISVKGAKAKLAAKTSGGSLELGELSGPAEVETAAGSIQVQSVRGTLAAKTSGGSIEIVDAQDAVNAQTSAGSVSAAFSAQPKGDCRLVTSGGNVEVKLAGSLSFDIEAKTSGGRVSTELPVTTTLVGEHKTGVLEGKLNGGGKALLLKTGAGNINIRRL